MRLSQRRIDIVAHNVANVTTPGYKRGVTSVRFADIAHASLDIPSMPQPITTNDQGKMLSTGNKLDLAISGLGYFVLRRGDVTAYSRSGQFRLDGDGRVVDGQGFALQQAGGGDLTLDTSNVVIEADGTVLDKDRPIARIALLAPSDEASPQRLGDSYVTAPDAAMTEADGRIHQGMLEGSNVVLTDEMVTMMAALRQAESGARLIQTYDELLGQAVDILGRGGK
ncbi:MAG: flagellar hook basal-body protein [Sphingomonas sp.]|nr:flagellar hook basal-body protein [Sphingomonas sp.]